MNKMIAVSYVIPIYNTPENLLKYGLDILIEEYNEKIEIILVDDGSSVNIAQICDLYAQKDSRIKVFHQINQGVSVARNVGIENAEGKYIVFVDPDDYVVDKFFKIDLLENSNEDLIVFDYIRKDHTDNETTMSLNQGGKIDKISLINNALFCDNTIPDCFGGAVWAKAFKRDFLISNNIQFNVKLRKAQDRIFMLCVYNLLNSIKYMNFPIYVYYENSASICNSYSKIATERSVSFANEVKTFFEKNNITGINNNVVVAKVFFISYFECLYLDLFNIENEENFFSNRKWAIKLYKEIGMQRHLKYIDFGMCFGIEEKIKYILIKHRLFGLLYITIHQRQKKRQNKR